MRATIYLDESGCLGWKLDAPYQRGGSSRFFTLAAAIMPDGCERLLERVVRGVYKQRGRPARNELKSVHLSARERINFAGELAKIYHKCPDVQFVSITVRKDAVNAAFRRSPNSLYNYMTKLLLLEVMSGYDSVSFIPDVRSLKIELKHSLHEYLCTELAGSGANIRLETTPWESKDSFCLQFVDWLAGIVWAHHEHCNGEAYKAASPSIRQRRLFF
ncbi:MULTISPECIES: DUF3800 domain-containing protein [Mycetohabitans]|nr:MULTISPECIES: DUF3800 domain-containing protein [Mycetohabitans]MCG1048758.1 DUF3800 domain-containing protein [Mycetohabitans sp. B6]